MTSIILHGKQRENVAVKHLMTGPKGKSGFCFDTHKPLRLSGKQN